MAAVSQVAIGSCEAQVRSGHLRRDGAFGASGGGAFMVVAPLAPPRLWSRVSDAVAASFERVMGQQAASQQNLERAMASAASAMSRVREALIEPHLKLDADVGIVALAGASLLVAISAGIRVYRSRAGVPERLFAQAPAPPTLGRGGLFVASEAAQRGDLYVMGPKDAFGVRSMGNLATLLSRKEPVPAAEIAEAILGPCRTTGVGTSVVVLTA